MIVGTATLSEQATLGSSSLRGKLYDPRCNKRLNQEAIRSPAIYQQFKAPLYLPHLVTADDVPNASGDLFPSGFYAWNTRAICAVSRSHIRHPSSYLNSQTLDVAAVESDVEDVVEVPNDEDTTR